MKTYITNEVIELYEEYMEKEYGKYYPEDAVDLALSFREWLKEKEQSEIPVKGQMIWVKDKIHNEWIKRYFHYFENKLAFCSKEIDSYTIGWDEYSLTDPNQ